MKVYGTAVMKNILIVAQKSLLQIRSAHRVTVFVLPE